MQVHSFKLRANANGGMQVRVLSSRIGAIKSTILATDKVGAAAHKGCFRNCPGGMHFF